MRATSDLVSKFLARILRHQPESAGLKLDKHGWADVEAVLSGVQAKFGTFTFQQLVQLVEANDKQRYMMSDDGRRIRAAQGHSIPVDLALEPVTPPPFLYHGTKSSSLPSIMRDGLTKARRHHVHLSDDLDTALRVGRRRAGATAVLQIRSGEMAEYVFLLSTNRVWLTEHVPARFISLVEEARLPR